MTFIEDKSSKSTQQKFTFSKEQPVISFDILDFKNYCKYKEKEDY